jgi:hypothetical protein
MLTVAQAMRAANFTDEESKNRTMQMQVRRALEKKRGGTVNNANPFLTPPVGVGTSVTAISSLTTTSASSSGGGEKDGVLFPQPALKRIRRTASAMQQDRINTLQKGNHFKEALKRATLEYSSESKKRDGKSAAKIAAEIKLQHDGVGPDARMITRYVNEYNHVGMSVETNPQRQEASDRLAKYYTRKDQHKITINGLSHSYLLNLASVTKIAVLAKH